MSIPARDRDLRRARTLALATPSPSDVPDIYLTLNLRTTAGMIRFVSTITTFGSPSDVTLDELALETFHPAEDLPSR